MLLRRLLLFFFLLLAGVLLRYCLSVPPALAASPALVAPAVLVYLAVRLWRPMLAMPLAAGPSKTEVLPVEIYRHLDVEIWARYWMR